MDIVKCNLVFEFAEAEALLFQVSRKCILAILSRLEDISKNCVSSTADTTTRHPNGEAYNGEGVEFRPCPPIFHCL